MRQADQHTCRVPVQISEVRLKGLQPVREIVIPAQCGKALRQRILLEARAILEKGSSY